jgi:hypothetical protein
MEFSKGEKLYAEIVQRAWDDDEFKKELVANPVVAIENFTGKKLNIPANKKLVVRDQTDESMVYIYIPAKPKTDYELNEKQLDMVSGGIIDNCFPDIIDWMERLKKEGPIN